MNKINRFLTITIVAQILLVLIIFLSSTRSKQVIKTPLLNMDFTAIDTIEIQGNDKQVTIVKNDDRWFATENQQLAVPKDTIPNIFADLQNLDVSWPVATTQNAAERFKVNDSNAVKIITFKQGEKTLSTLYLGSSPGLRKIHARVDGSNDIYAVEFSSHRLPVDSNEWFDKKLLATNSDLIAIKTEQFELIKDGSWTFNPLPEGKVSNDKAIKNWIDKFSNLEVNKLIPPSAAEKITIQNPVLTVNIRTDSTNTDYAFYQSNNETYVKIFGDIKLFSILDYEVKPILDATAEQFINDTSTVQDNEEDVSPGMPLSNLPDTSVDSSKQGVLDMEE